MVCSVVQSENYTSNQTGKTIRGHSTRFSCPVRFWMRLHALEFTVYGTKMDEWMHLTLEVFEQSWDWVPRSEKFPSFEEQNVAWIHVGSCKTCSTIQLLRHYAKVGGHSELFDRMSHIQCQKMWKAKWVGHWNLLKLGSIPFHSRT